jgi:3-oxoacyl-[acyl-carrier-protein] synthase II
MNRRFAWFGPSGAPVAEAAVTANVARGGSSSLGDEYALINNEYPALRLAEAFRTEAPPLVVNTACATGATALRLAVDAIRFGECDRALVVASDFSVAAENLVRFSLLSALSRENDPERASRPFSRTRDGFVMGEGAAAFVLESRDALRARGGRALAEVLGHADVTDSFHRTRSDPSSEPVAECMRRAVKDAGLRPEDIDCINAHGTGTVENDRNEDRGIGMVFGERRRSLPVTSNKSMIGHTLTAAGLVEAAFSVLSLRHGIAPPTIHCEDKDERLEIDVVNEGARRLPLGSVLTNSFGFGGQNVSIVLGAAR